MAKAIMKAWSLLVITLILLGSGMPMAEMAERPVINWQPYIYMPAQGNGQTVTAEQRRQLAAVITDKLHRMQLADRLPFTLKEYNDEYNINRAKGNELALIAVLVDDTVLESQYLLNGTGYNKAFVLCGIDLSICTVDEQNQGMRILYTIPLRGYDVISETAGETGLWKQRQQQVFCRLAEMLIDDELSFKGLTRQLETVELRAIEPQTSQVSDVKISSPKAQQVFAGDTEKLKQLLAGIFTSRYQRANDAVVYPSLVGGGWEKEAVENFYAMQLSSPGGGFRLMMRRATNPIVLDFNGIASGEIKSKKPSTVKYDVGYKAWLRLQTENGSSREVSRLALKQYPKNHPEAVRISEKTIYTELLIELANELAEQRVEK